MEQYRSLFQKKINAEKKIAGNWSKVPVQVKGREVKISRPLIIFVKHIKKMRNLQYLAALEWYPVKYKKS